MTRRRRQHLPSKDCQRRGIGSSPFLGFRLEPKKINNKLHAPFLVPPVCALVGTMQVSGIGFRLLFSHLFIVTSHHFLV